MSNRPIKFRVWDGERMLSPEEAKGYRLAPDGTLWHWGPVATPVPASHSIALQFTGLTDAEGREVYEGDIASWTDYDGKMRGTQMCGSVGFYSEGDGVGGAIPGCWAVFRLIQGMPYCEDSLHDILTRTGSRVVGNIYENPDLLDA